jgi:hypothetical protein
VRFRTALETEGCADDDHFAVVSKSAEGRRANGSGRSPRLAVCKLQEHTQSVRRTTPNEGVS